MSNPKTIPTKAPTKAPTKKRNPHLADGAVITLLKKENPRRPGSAAYNRFALYRDGMTVAEYLAAGKKAGLKTRRSNVTTDAKRKNIALEMPKPKA